MKKLLFALLLLPSIAFGQSAAVNLSQLAHGLSHGGIVPCGFGGTGSSGTPANGAIPIGNGTCFTLGTITAGTGITVTNTSGGITIASTVGGMVYPGSGIPQSTGTAWGTSITPGTGVVTALGVNVGSAGAVVVNGGALGTPSSGNGSNITNVNAASVGGFTLPCTVPTLVSGDYLTNNGSTCSWAAVSGSGTVTDGTGTTTPNEILLSSSTSHAYTLASTFPVALPLTGYATASLPTCNSAAKGAIAYTTDGTPAFTFCNGTSWVNNGGTQFTYSATGCTPSAASGDATGGSITLAAGPCTSIVVTFNGAVGMTASHMWVCSVNDQTALNAGTYIPAWGQKSSTTTTATIPIPAAVGSTDVVAFNCTPH